MTIENVKCPDCDGPMISRLNKKNQSRFWGCKNFPVCKGTRDVDGNSKKDYNDDDDGENEAIRWDRKS